MSNPKRIMVSTNDGQTNQIDGASWHIDDDGYLHIRGIGGNVASFHRTAWTSVWVAT